MRILQNITIALFIVVTLAFAGTKAYTHYALDRTPPVIACASDVIETQVGSSEAALLNGVTAQDDRDGDLTSQIMIKGVTKLITADTAKITYIVFDSSNNMATAQRTVHYTNYEKPKFSLSSPLFCTTGSSIQLLKYLSASDVLDGDISNSIRVTTQNISFSTAGTYTATVQVTNSLGDVESIPVKVVVIDYVPMELPVTLSSYIVYLKTGAAFTPASYLVTPAAGSGVDVKSNVDTSTPGTYEASYTYQNYTVYQTVIVR